MEARLLVLVASDISWWKMAFWSDLF